MYFQETTIFIVFGMHIQQFLGIPGSKSPKSFKLWIPDPQFELFRDSRNTFLKFASTKMFLTSKLYVESERGET